MSVSYESRSTKQKLIYPSTVTCQGWDSRHDLRPDQGQTNVFNTISEDAESIIRHILEGPYPGNSTVSYASTLHFN